MRTATIDPTAVADTMQRLELMQLRERILALYMATPRRRRRDRDELWELAACCQVLADGEELSLGGTTFQNQAGHLERIPTRQDLIDRVFSITADLLPIVH